MALNHDACYDSVCRFTLIIPGISPRGCVLREIFQALTTASLATTTTGIQNVGAVLHAQSPRTRRGDIILAINVQMLAPVVRRPVGTVMYVYAVMHASR